MEQSTALPLRDYQSEGVRKAASFASTARSTDRLLLASPTGTGKSYVILEALAALPGWVAVVPSIDIITGMLAKIGVQAAGSDEAIVEIAAQHRMYTPLRFRNGLLNGTMQPPAGIIVDEGHHDESDTHQQIDALCDCPKIAITATPYRGTPRSTIKFRQRWGEPHWLIKLPDAVARRVISLPVCDTWPLVDDDLIEITAGELNVSQVVGETRNKLDDIVARCKAAAFFDSTGRPTRPTVFAVPSGIIAEELQAKCQAAGLATSYIVQGTPRPIRNEIYRRAAEGTHALINVKVVGEGVDLPLRRFIDLSPTMSPVLWMQRLGRITRPSDDAPHYVCCNRNLMRHFYLLDGALPPIYLTQSIAAFGNLTSRAGARAFGLEGMGKLKAVECKLTSGLSAHCYSITEQAGKQQTQYFVIVHPLHSRPVWASRCNVKEGEAMVWGKWQLCAAPDELCGFRSLPGNRAMSEKQAAWWKRDAQRYGLAGEPDTKLFPILPVLSQAGVKLT